MYPKRIHTSNKKGAPDDQQARETSNYGYHPKNTPSSKIHKAPVETLLLATSDSANAAVHYVLHTCLNAVCIAKGCPESLGLHCMHEES